MTAQTTDEPGVRDLARALGSNPGSVVRWLRKGMPRDPAAARAWREQHARQRVKPAASAADDLQAGGSFSSWRARRERAAALQAELDLRRQAGNLVVAEDVKRALAIKVVAFRDHLLTMCDRLAPVVAAEPDQARCWALLRDEVHYSLQLLTRRDDQREDADEAR